MDNAPGDQPSGLNRDGSKVLLGTALGPVIMGAIVFGAAWSWRLPRVWLWLAVSFVGMLGNIAIVAAFNPQLVNHRGAWKKKRDVKRWDKLLVMLFGIVGFYVLPLVMGVDLRRSLQGGLDMGYCRLGVALFAFATVVLTWAMLVNRHFEATVRIQSDRDHRVVTGGPYAIVRHPGYIGASLWVLTPPLIVGSVWGLIPGVVAAAILVVRTRLEDETLKRELDGYEAYAKRVRYRLVPWIW